MELPLASTASIPSGSDVTRPTRLGTAPVREGRATEDTWRPAGGRDQQLPDQPREVGDVGPFSGLARRRVVVRDRDPEVGEVRRTVVVEEHVRCLHVVVRDASGMGGDQRTADLLDEPRHARERPGAAGDHRLTGGPPVEQTEDEVGATRLAPVVVERDDVGVLEPSDESSLGLEAADEVGRVGEIGTDHLDRHQAVGARLRGRVHPAERALADGVVDRVPAQRPVGRAPGKLVVGQHGGLELEELA
jgi:hypothetical protein